MSAVAKCKEWMGVIAYPHILLLVVVNLLLLADRAFTCMV